jgi:hypothetical protein
MLYIIYDADGVNQLPVYGVYDNEEAATKAIDEIVEKMVEDCLAEDPAESGLDKSDRNWLKKDCFNSLAIQTLPEINTYKY